VLDLEAVLFDLDDTLHDDTLAYKSAAGRVARDVAQRCGIDPAQLQAAYIAQAEEFWTGLTDDQLATKLAGVRVRLWSAALAEVGILDSPLARRCADDYNRYRGEYLQLFPGAMELLQSLRGAGLKLGLLTNGFAETHREKIALLHLSDAFDEIFIADEVGMLKPDPLLFAHACAGLGVAPERTAMVGDRYERDVRGAHAAGLVTIWMNVHGGTLPPGAPSPDATVADLAGVAAALGYHS